MTSSPLPWTIKIGYLDNPELPSALIYDQSGKPIANFLDARDAELVLLALRGYEKLDHRCIQRTTKAYAVLRQSYE